MEKITIKELEKLQKKYGFKLARLKGTNGIHIMKHNNDRMEIISLKDFEQALKKRGLAVYKSPNDFLKIMKDRP